MDDIGLLCLILDGARAGAAVGMLRLQKTAYFCRYIGWNVRDYRLHGTGPYSYTLVEAVHAAGSAGVMEEDGKAPCRFALTERGRSVLGKFQARVCGDEKAGRARRLARHMSYWSALDLEVVSTIDYVDAGSDYHRDELIRIVGGFSGGRSLDKIERLYAKWRRLRRGRVLGWRPSA